MKVKVDVPATNGRKAYSYFREGGEEPVKNREKKASSTRKAVNAFSEGAKGTLLGAVAFTAGANVASSVKDRNQKIRNEIDYKNQAAREERWEKRSQQAEERWRKREEDLEEEVKSAQAEARKAREASGEQDFRDQTWQNYTNWRKNKGRAGGDSAKEYSSGGYSRYTEDQKGEAYSVLGLERGATKKEVKEAHREMSRKHHPDVSKDPNAPERMKKINNAKDILWADSLLCRRIDSFIQSLGTKPVTYTSSDFPLSAQENMDAQVTVKVPARAGRKAYEYTKNTSGSGDGKRKANVGLGVGLAVGSAAILGGLAATAAAKKGDRDADRKRNSETASATAQRSRESTKILKEKVEQQRAEYEAKTSKETPEQIEAARKKSADLQERMKKPIETAEESDAKRRAAGAKAIAENENAKAQASAEEKKRAAEAKKKKDEEIRQKDEEYRNSSEYKAAVKSYPSRAREQAKTSEEYQSEKFADKASRDLRKEGAKGKGKKSGGGFAKRNNSLYERIDAFINQLRCV